jgi:GNAT superfamily N-acetyltransferase
VVSDLSIRPARADDRDAMERICAHTFEWGDYIPEVWDDWLDHDKGLVSVGEVAGRVVALSRITFQTPCQTWLGGMRVDPEYRRQGIAGAFLGYDLSCSRGRGARVARLATGDHNVAVHTIASRAGMERVGRYVLWTAEPLPGRNPPLILSSDHAIQVQDFLLTSPVLAHCHGLYSSGWAWQELSAERVRNFLDSGQVSAQVAPGGSLAALAPLATDPHGERMWICFADGEPSAVTALASAVRGYASQAGVEQVSTMLPDVAWLRDAFRAAGYGLGDWEGELWVFERRLGGDGSDEK